MKKTFKLGGIHPAEHKTASTEIHFQPLPMLACVPLSQHIGAPAVPVVAKGDKVARGMIIAKAGGNVSAPLHAPISGIIQAIDNVVMPDGRPAKAIIIKADEGEHAKDEADRRDYWENINKIDLDSDSIEALTPDELRAKVAEAGLVGLGGATFPSHIKLITKASKPKILLINGCECEPYLTCDDALMRAWPRQAVQGAIFLAKAAGIEKVIIAIEDNKPDAIAAITAASEPFANVAVQVVKTKYPQGGEKQLIQAVTGRRVPSGGLPAVVGVIVNNIATAFAAWQAIAAGMPLIERLVTVTGDIPSDQQRNYMTALGTPFADFTFTLPENPTAIIGGPMMGRTAVRLDAPVTKGSSGLLLLAGRKTEEVLPCIRCARCVDVCPMGLEPYLLSTLGRLHMWDEARRADVADCIECGSCSYICPAKRPLLEFIRIAKQRSR